MVWLNERDSSYPDKVILTPIKGCYSTFQEKIHQAL